MPVQFPFGFGLSYTTFAYSNLQVSSSAFRDVDGVTVRVDVTNTGSVAGKEVVQLYVHDKKASLVRPPKELKGFAKVHLQPGETKTVTISLDSRSFSFFHPGYGQWVAEAGEFTLLVGASSVDIRLQADITLESTVDLPSLLNIDSTLAEWIADPRGRVVAADLLANLEEGMRATFGGNDDNSLGDGLDLMGFLMEMPLVGLLNFREDSLPQPPEVIVGGLLDAVHS
jgi:beta-glucosidase